METKSKLLKEPDGNLSLNAANDTLGLARNKTGAKSAKDAFDSVNLLLATIRVRFLPARVGQLLTDIRRIQ
jgi:hypothetical protein